MINNFALSRIFIVTPDFLLSEKITAQLPSNLECNTFSDWTSCYKDVYLLPDVIFFEVTSSNEAEEFVQKMLLLDEKILIVMVLRNQDISIEHLLDRNNIFACVRHDNLDHFFLLSLLENLKRVINFRNKINQLETKLTIKSLIEKEVDDTKNSKLENTISNFLDQEMTFDEYKFKIIHHYLEKYNGDILRVSNKLDIGKSTIYRMLKSEKEKKDRKIDWLNTI